MEKQFAGKFHLYTLPSGLSCYSISGSILSELVEDERTYPSNSVRDVYKLFASLASQLAIIRTESSSQPALNVILEVNCHRHQCNELAAAQVFVPPSLKYLKLYHIAVGTTQGESLSPNDHILAFMPFIEFEIVLRTT
jgi:hypothetical protein